MKLSKALLEETYRICTCSFILLVNTNIVIQVNLDLLFLLQLNILPTIDIEVF